MKELVPRIDHVDDRGLHEVTLIVARGAADDHAAECIFIHAFEPARKSLERALVDDRAHEIAEVRDVAHTQTLGLVDDAIACFFPE